MITYPLPTVRRTTRNAPKPLPEALPEPTPKPTPPMRARIYVPLVPPGIDNVLLAIGAMSVALRSIPTKEGRVEALTFILRRFGIKWTDLS